MDAAIMNPEAHTRDNKHGVVVMDQVEVCIDGEWSPWSTVMWSKRRGFYLNPLYGSNIYLKDHAVDNVRITKKWPDEEAEG